MLSGVLKVLSRLCKNNCASTTPGIHIHLAGSACCRFKAVLCWLESTAVWTWPTKTTVFLQHRAAMFTWQAVLAAGSKLFTEIYCSVDLANKIRCVSTTPGSHTWQAVLAAGSKLFTGIYCSVHLANKNSTHKVQIKLVSALSPRIAWSLLRI